MAGVPSREHIRYTSYNSSSALSSNMKRRVCTFLTYTHLLIYLYSVPACLHNVRIRRVESRVPCLGHSVTQLLSLFPRFPRFGDLPEFVFFVSVFFFSLLCCACELQAAGCRLRLRFPMPLCRSSYHGAWSFPPPPSPQFAITIPWGGSIRSRAPPLLCETGRVDSHCTS